MIIAEENIILHMEIKKTATDKIITQGLTFDDVLVVPLYSEILPREVDISTQLTRDIRINVPIVSAAMDTVTEKRLAIAIARQGGLGFIHKNMIIEAQAEQVRAVKRSESGMIKEPVTESPEAGIGYAQDIMRELKIAGSQIKEGAGKLVGI